MRHRVPQTGSAERSRASRIADLLGAPRLSGEGLTGELNRELLATVLSSVRERGLQRADRLLERFGSLQAVGQAPREALAEELKQLGFWFNPRHPRLSRLQRLAACLSELDVLELSIDAARDELVSLPGIGPEYAETALRNAYGIPRDSELPLPHSTWKLTAERLGLAPPDATEEEIIDCLLVLVGPTQMLGLIRALDDHAEHRCWKRLPHCQGCRVVRLCPSAHHASR
jgi:endonuclease III